eukprot:sb/3467486/
MTPEEESQIRLEVACLQYVQEPNEDAFAFIVKQPVKTLQLVETLQEHATAREDDTRGNAFMLLSKAAAARELNENEVSCLIKFFSSRLSEKYNVLPVVLEALTHLAGCKEDIPMPTVAMLLSELFAEVDTQSFSRATRYSVYQLVQTLLQKHLISPMKEIVFEAISCYYPIDYTPPSDQEEGRVVTGEELKVKLNNCFKASASLSSLAIPFLVDKFGTSLLQTRLDSCVTLKACLMSYGVLCSPEHLTLVWNTLKTEIFGGLNENLRSRLLWKLLLVKTKGANGNDTYLSAGVRT